eukprot:gnl/TRDRNA2_/TRDRNA2_174748_c1_seq1.p1 gnl/TRDRNA2_/TRDRNA2_174748_c1~~gnl/TRDRNA2_/TRDRNA2_174748_c1_seq1.p1  ORF type:complete len:276 (-),score=41.18 gnl/TRDRNA2_/TRDRNA2_174748_c1_seq1:232-1059(-)
MRKTGRMLTPLLSEPLVRETTRRGATAYEAHIFSLLIGLSIVALLSVLPYVAGVGKWQLAVQEPSDAQLMDMDKIREAVQKVKRVFCKEEKDFATLEEWEDYEIETEDFLYRLCEEIDVADTELRLKEQAKIHRRWFKEKHPGAKAPMGSSSSESTQRNISEAAKDPLGISEAAKDLLGSSSSGEAPKNVSEADEFDFFKPLDADEPQHMNLTDEEVIAQFAAYNQTLPDYYESTHGMNLSARERARWRAGGYTPEWLDERDINLFLRSFGPIWR